MTVHELRPDRHADPEPAAAQTAAERTVFVLGGGGNLGAVQVGMLRALIERGHRPDAVVGCSVGAINAAGIAADPTLAGVERLEHLWRTLDGETVCPSGRLNGFLLLARRYRSLQSNDGLRRLLEAELPHRLFEDYAVPLHVVATSLRTGTERWFSRGPVVEPILASASLPAVFPPVEIDGDPLVDGAVVNNVPISRALELEATRVVVLHVGNFDKPRPMPKRPLDALLQSFSISRNFRFLQEVDVAGRAVDLLVLPAIDPGSIRYNDFGRAPELMARAYAATSTFLDTRESATARG